MKNFIIVLFLLLLPVQVFAVDGIFTRANIGSGGLITTGSSTLGKTSSSSISTAYFTSRHGNSIAATAIAAAAITNSVVVWDSELVDTGTYTTSIPVINQGGKIPVSSSLNLNFENRFANPYNYTCFLGSGSISFAKAGTTTESNVLWWTQVIDGITDNSASFQKAANSLLTVTTGDDSQAGVAILRIPGGRYVVNDVLIPSGVSVVGDGFWNTMIFNLAGTSSFKFSQGPNHPGSMITGLNLRGGYQEGALGVLYILNRTSVEISGCFLSGHRPIYIDGSTEVLIHDNIFDSGVYHIYSNNGRQIQVTGNIFYNGLIRSLDFEGGSVIDVSHNIFEDQYYDSVYLAGVDGYAVEDNFILSSLTASNVNSAAVGITSDHCKNGDIKDNKIPDGQQKMTGISILATSGTSSNITASWNRMSNVRNGILTLNTGSSIELSHNKIEKVYQYPIKSNIDGTLIERNDIKDGNQQGSSDINLGCGITVGGDQNKLVRNTVTSTDSKMLCGVFVGSGKTVYMTDNNLGSAATYSTGETIYSAGATVTSDFYTTHAIIDSLLTSEVTITSGSSSEIISYVTGTAKSKTATTADGNGGKYVIMVQDTAGGAPVEVARFVSALNFGLGATSFGNGGRVFGILANNPPNASIINGALVYSEAVSGAGTAGLKIRSEDDAIVTLGDHINMLVTSPTTSVSACGGSPTLAAGGNDLLGTVTTGSGSPTSCTVNYGKRYTNTALCIPINVGTTTASLRISAQSNTGFTVTGTSTFDGFNYHCFGNE